MRAYWNILSVIFLFSLVWRLSARGQQENGVKTHYAISDPKGAATIVAKVGPIDITAQQFLLSYEFGPAFPKRQSDSKRRYLDFMINEKLLALDGYSRGLQRSDRVVASVAEIEGDLATEELYKDDVLSKVRVTEGEIDEAMHGEHVHRSFHWLYTKTRDEIQHAESLLHTGVPFDSLFKLQVRDSSAREERSMETTLFKLRRQAPALAAVVDTLIPGAPSAPIHGPDGWYIVYIVDGWNDPLTTESENFKLRSDVERALIQQKSDSLSDQYVRRMMLNHDPVIVRRTFDLLRAWLGSKVLPPEKFSSWELARRFEEESDSVDLAHIDRYGKETLVTLNRGSISLRDFLVWYRAREFYVHLGISSPQSFFVSIEQLVWRMVRDKLLLERAMKRNLQHRKFVKTQKKWWEEKILYELAKSDLSNSIALDTQTLRDYYEERSRNYRNEKGEPVPFERAKDDVRKDLYSFELTKRLLHRILILKRKYPIEVRERTLRDLPVDTENQPKAVDVYAVKKGGIFPRPAFPTIDYQWHTWD